jgi:branched-subunit amino acid aminotransferase/4-amino-4-deoxychorismate lyase
MIWMEGRIIPPDALRIDARDETFQHGLGLFETLRTWKGHPTLLFRHLDRMRSSASKLNLWLDLDQLPDDRAVQKLVAASRATTTGPVADWRIRITLSGGRASVRPRLARSSLWMTAGILVPPSPNRAAVIKQTIQIAPDDPLARHKTLNYWRKRIARTKAFQEGADEVLCVTPDGLVCEGTGTNIFLVNGRRLITPSTDGPLLPGIMRQVVLDHARHVGLEVVEGRVPIAQFADADEAFLTNSVQGMLPIARLLDRDLPAPGSLTRELWNDILPWLESGGSSP